MGQRIYTGWWGRQTFAHCNDINGINMCEARYRGQRISGPDQHSYGWTRQDVLRRGWKLCPSCNRRENQEVIERVELAIKERRLSMTLAQTRLRP